MKIGTAGLDRWGRGCADWFKRVSVPSIEGLKGVDWAKWANHFERNQRNRKEPGWDSEIDLSPEQIRTILPSLQQFELGDGGGPACLIAFDAEPFRTTSPEIQRVIDGWFEEEKGHARLLGCAVDRLGGRHIRSHWSFSAFCTCRRWLGVRFELQVLLLTEIVSSAYYRVLRRHLDDLPVKEMCGLILRDESGHIAFHLDRVAAADRSVTGLRRSLWQSQFVVLGYCAATLLWVNHGKCLRPFGATNAEFYREVGRELRRFLGRLHRVLRQQTPSAAASAVRPVTRCGVS